MAAAVRRLLVIEITGNGNNKQSLVAKRQDGNGSRP